MNTLTLFLIVYFSFSIIATFYFIRYSWVLSKKQNFKEWFKVQDKSIYIGVFFVAPLISIYIFFKGDK